MSGNRSVRTRLESAIIGLVLHTVRATIALVFLGWMAGVWLDSIRLTHF